MSARTLLVKNNLILYENTSIVFMNALTDVPVVYPANNLKKLLCSGEEDSRVVFPVVPAPPAAEDGVVGEVRFDAAQRRLYVHTGTDWAYATLS